MQLNKFVSEILNYGQEWKVNKIDKDDDNLVINIHVSYVENTYTMEDGEQYKVYDFSPVRQWQHLAILEYATYIHCKLPRIVMEDKIGKKNNEILFTQSFLYSHNLHRRHGSLRKELNVKTPFEALEKWYQLKPEIFLQTPSEFKNKLLNSHVEIVNFHQ